MLWRRYCCCLCCSRGLWTTNGRSFSRGLFLRSFFFFFIFNTALFLQVSLDSFLSIHETLGADLWRSVCSFFFFWWAYFCFDISIVVSFFSCASKDALSDVLKRVGFPSFGNDEGGWCVCFLFLGVFLAHSSKDLSIQGRMGLIFEVCFLTLCFDKSSAFCALWIGSLLWCFEKSWNFLHFAFGNYLTPEIFKFTFLSFCFVWFFLYAKILVTLGVSDSVCTWWFWVQSAMAVVAWQVCGGPNHRGVWGLVF